MNLDSLIYDIEAHPVVVAIVVFIALLAGTVFFKKSPATPAASVNVDGPLHPTTSEVYNQTFNSYPTAPSPVHVDGPAPMPTPDPKPTPTPTPTPVTTPKPAPAPAPKPKPTPVKTTSGTYIHPTAWPSLTSTLSGIASHYGTTLQRIQQLNPWIYQQRHTWNLIYTSDSIRIN